MNDALRFYDRAVSRLTRRQLLNVAWRLGGAAMLTPLVPRRLMAQPSFKSDPFSLGVASGDPWPTSIVLWTRLAPDPLAGGGMPMAHVEVGWEVSRESSFRTVAHRGTVIARPELGHSVHVEVEGLEAGREYWYRFHAGSATSPIARTKTAPPAGGDIGALRYAACGCNNYEIGFFTAFGHLADEQFDFVFHTGDYIYEGRDHAGRNARAVRRHHGDEIYSLVDYRNRYAQYKSDPHLQAAHASAPFIVTWDDHEVDNDYAGDADERDTPPEVFMLRRAAAYQAYFEAMPLRPSLLPLGPAMRLYRRLVFGNLIDFNVLDTRQFRSDQGCGGSGATNCAAAIDPSRTMLGSEQERWLFENLASARARWTVIGQQVPTFARDNAAAAPSARFSMDKWDGYIVARQRLYTRLRDTRAPNPIILSGDVHLHYGADLKLDFTNPASTTIGVEFTNSSITSGGDGAEVGETWERIRPDNPHIKFHSARRGYIACTATPQTMRADFKVIDRVSVPDADLRTAGSLVVEAGRPGASTDGY